MRVTHSQGVHVGRINRIKPSIETVTVSPGDALRLEVDIYGRQDILDNDHGDIHAFDWSDGDADGSFSSDERRGVFTAPTAPGAHKITASIGRDECNDESIGSCTATFQVIVKRQADTTVEVPEPVNPRGEIPSILTDDDGTAYDVLTPVGGGSYVGGLTAPPGAVPNCGFIGVSVLKGNDIPSDTSLQPRCIGLT